ncbi:MAG TPA: GlsB/YeaQ/YmgE family stress response membrane protein [Gemmataceae bacterium]|nr:GlsB/YeaQ/YmgE family stress response membrane protein [Gemmataceae bacterium]
MIAQFVLNPGGLCAWLTVGLLAGWLTGLLMRGRGYGIIRDVVLGLIGSLIGGLVFSFFFEGATGFWGSVGVAAVGAIMLVIIVRAFTRPPPL